MLAEILNYADGKSGFFLLCFWGSIILTVGILIVLLYLVFLRLAFLIKRSRSRTMESEWSPIFRLLRSGEEPAKFPIVSRSNKKLLLELWLRERRYADSRYAAALDSLATRFSLRRAVLSILRPGIFDFLPRQVWLQHAALESAVFIHDSLIRREIFELANSDDELVAIQACNFLTALKIRGFERKIISLMFRFPGRITGIFDQIASTGGSSVLHTVRPFLPRLPENTVINFIQFAEMGNDVSLLPVLEERLASGVSDEENASLLRAIGKLGGPEQRLLCIPFLDSDNAFVRIQAATCLGKIGTAYDIDRIIPLLRDSAWWVRYRSAQAILRLMEFDEEDYEDLRDSLEDQYAREILIHSYEEYEWHLT